MSAPNLEFENLSLDGYKSSWKERYADRKISPRMRIAAKLYQSGIAKTLGEAAKLAGLAPSSLYAMNVSDNDEFNRLSAKAAADRDIATGDINVVLQRLGRSALTKLHTLMETSDSEGIQLKAAQDLADRSPETSKVQKLAISSISLDGQDVAKLTSAMVEAAEVKSKFIEVTQGDFVRVSTDAPVQAEMPALPAPLRDDTTPITIEVPDAGRELPEVRSCLHERIEGAQQSAGANAISAEVASRGQERAEA